MVVNYNSSVRRNPIHGQTTKRRVSKEKVVSPKGRLKDKMKSSDHGKPTQEIGSVSSLSHDVAGIGEYVSDIACSVEDMNIGDDEQEKALSFGVIDLQRLENWAYGQKPFSMSFRAEDVPMPPLSPRGPQSCPLLSEAEAPITKPKGKHDKQKNSTEHSIASRVDRMCKDESRASNTMGRELSPANCSDAGLSGSTGGDNRSANCRGRRSPMRRMLDMVQKPKNRISFSGPMVSPIHDAQEAFQASRFAMIEELVSRYWAGNSFPSTMNSSISQEKGSIDLPSKRQALVQLTGENDMPLLMFSSDGNNVVAATMRKNIVSDKDDSECIYTIMSAHEVKKKSGMWTNQGNKSKKHRLVSNVVAQLKVSGPKTISSDSKAHSLEREFVLLGAEPSPGGDGSDNASFNRELASIIVSNPEEEPVGTPGDVLKSLSSIMVLLPSGVHGMPATGGPSPLIDRWRSGGACDCGGWDEGCGINVLYLHDKVQESRSSDDIHPIELLVQGGTRENWHCVSMVGCKEGLYKVEFTKSIALLQAFAISIASLHNRKPANHSWVGNSEEAKSFGEHILVKAQEGFPGYVTRHHPLSPIGRA